MSDLKKAIGKNLRMLREEKGVSQDAIAKAVGTTRQTISRLELGKRSCSVEWAEKIASVLEVSRADILLSGPSERIEQALQYISQTVTLNEGLLGNGTTTKVAKQNLPAPINDKDGEGLWFYQMADDSMEAARIYKGDIMIAADPEIHDLPILAGSIVFVNHKNKKYVRKFVMTDGQAFLTPCTVEPAPSLKILKLDLTPSGGRKPDNTVNMNDIFGVLYWVYQNHSFPSSSVN